MLAGNGHAETRGGADLWFVTLEGSAKLDEIAFDPHVNLLYYKDRTRESVSVSGFATISRDRDTIRELWAPDWQAWFPKGEDPRHGTADDPRMVLVGVNVLRGGVSRSEQAAAGRAFRAREGLADGLDARARRDTSRRQESLTFFGHEKK